VFLFDEPLSNLDAKLRVAMRTQIKRLHEMLGTTTIYVTHDQVEAMTLADRVVILRLGEIVQAGTPVEVYESPNCQFVGEFIGSPQMNVLRARVQRQADRTTLDIADARIPVKEIDRPTGDEVHVGIRPEHLNWCAPNEAFLSPMLDVYEPLGSDTMAICLLDDQELTARLDPKLPLKRKETIHLNFSTENLHVFDRASGQKVPFVA
jgi:ABC-type sugar transport system ATPase subunit